MHCFLVIGNKLLTNDVSTYAVNADKCEPHVHLLNRLEYIYKVTAILGITNTVLNYRTI